MPARRSRFRPSRLFAVFTALLSVAVAILWADSYRRRGDFLFFSKDGPPFFGEPYTVTLTGMYHSFDLDKLRQLSIRSHSGSLRVEYGSGTSGATVMEEVHYSLHSFEYSQLNAELVLESALYTASPDTVVYRTRSITTPYWGPFLLLVFFPTIYFIRGPLRRHRRRSRGQCIECGYDLRGSAGRCPECGAAAMDGPVVVRSDGPTV